MSEEEIDKLEHTFDVAQIPLATNIIEAHQEGNFIIGLTETGIRFRQHIPQGKILNKLDGKWVLQDMEIVHSS